MGSWSLQGISHRSSVHDDGGLFGNHYSVDFRLRYARSLFDRYKEPPKLDWHETIMMIDHQRRRYWVFEANMYEHDPLSRTLEVWAKRYRVAYAAAAGLPTGGRGRCVLVDALGRPVPVDEIGRGIIDGDRQADEIRGYLSSHGGGFDIRIDDIPSIRVPEGGEHKERLLIFDCGIVGGGPRARAIQHLEVDHARLRRHWTRRFDLSWTMTGLETTGLAHVAPPPRVAGARVPVFAPGECW